MQAGLDEKVASRSNSILSPSGTVTDLPQAADIDKKSIDSNHNHLPAESTLGEVEKGREDRGEVDHHGRKPNALSVLPPFKKSLLLLLFVSLPPPRPYIIVANTLSPPPCSSMSQVFPPHSS